MTTITLAPDDRARLIAVAGCAAQGSTATGRPALANLRTIVGLAMPMRIRDNDGHADTPNVTLLDTVQVAA